VSGPPPDPRRARGRLDDVTVTLRPSPAAFGTRTGSVPWLPARSQPSCCTANSRPQPAILLCVPLCPPHCHVMSTTFHSCQLQAPAVICGDVFCDPAGLSVKNCAKVIATSAGDNNEWSATQALDHLLGLVGQSGAQIFPDLKFSVRPAFDSSDTTPRQH
jgi:hypothetical protein